MATIDYTYNSKTETPQQYLARTQGSQAPSSSPAPSSGSSDFLSALQDRLIGQSDLISSANTNLDSSIANAIKGVQGATSASDAATTSEFNRQIGYAQDQGANSVQGNLDSRSGFATNIVALRNLVQTTDKNVNDLEQRKQELILQNDAAGASKIADLQMQALDFKQKYQQQVFQNLLSVGSFAQQNDANNRANEAQSFNEKQAISQIGLQFGIPVQPGDTIDTISARAAPFASEEQKLKLDEMRAQINSSNAQSAKALSDLAANKPLDSTSLEALARQYQTNPSAVLGVVKTTAQLGQILDKVGQVSYSDGKDHIDQTVSDGTFDLNTIVGQITSSASLSPAQKSQLVTYATSVASKVPAKTSGSISLADIAGGAAKGTLQGSQSALEFLTGIKNASKVKIK